MSGLTPGQGYTLSRAALMLDRYGPRLPADMREPLEGAVATYRRRGVTMTLDDHQWTRIQEALAALIALRDQDPLTAVA